MSHRWWALTALALLACGPPPPPPGPAILYSPCSLVQLVPATDTTDAELASIHSAVAMWRQVGVTALTLSGSPEGLPVRFKAAAAVFHGIYEPSSGLVSINRGLEGTEREVTVAHELGHALGLPHVDRATRASVMNPANLTVLPTPEDEQALQRLWGCPL